MHQRVQSSGLAAKGLILSVALRHCRSYRFVTCKPGPLKMKDKYQKNNNWLVVSTHLKNISQNGNLPQVGVKIKNIWVATNQIKHVERIPTCELSCQTLSNPPRPRKTARKDCMLGIFLSPKTLGKRRDLWSDESYICRLFKTSKDPIWYPMSFLWNDYLHYAISSNKFPMVSIGSLWFPFGFFMVSYGFCSVL